MRARRALVVALAAAAAGVSALRVSGGGSGALPGPSPSRRIAPGENARCERCHQEIAAEWRRSEHHGSFTDPVFQRAFSVEPKPFCKGCHAPEARLGEADEPAEAIGIGCVTCHSQGKVALASPRALPSLAPHRLDRQAAFATAQACAGCHQFSFDDDERRGAPLLMQRTVDEHRASPFADRSCASCHMPLVGEGLARHRSHAFAGAREPEQLGRALSIEASRPSPGVVVLRLSPREVGHSLPTGDLFRRLSVSAEVVADDYRVLAQETRYLGRHFVDVVASDGRPMRLEQGDDRPTPSRPAEVRLELGPRALGRTVLWRVSLERVLHLDPRHEAQAWLSGETEVARGQLGPGGL